MTEIICLSEVKMSSYRDLLSRVFPYVLIATPFQQPSSCQLKSTSKHCKNILDCVLKSIGSVFQ